MKKLALLLILTSIFKLGISQKLKINSEKQIVIDTTIYFDSTTSANIYKAVKKWAATNLENVNETIIYDTPEEIQFRYRQKVVSSIGGKWNVSRTLIVKIKDGKLNMEFSKMSTTKDKSGAIENVLLKNNGTFRIAFNWQSMITAIEDQFTICAETISKNIHTKNDNW